MTQTRIRMPGGPSVLNGRAPALQSVTAGLGAPAPEPDAAMRDDPSVETALADEEAALRGMYVSGAHTQEERGRAYLGYVGRVASWRRGQGAGEEEIASWRKSFGDSLNVEAALAQFDRILQHDPDVALRLARAARGEVAAPGETGGDEPKSAHVRSLASGYAEILAPEQLQLIQNKAEAEQHKRRLLAEERADVVQADARSVLRRAVDGGDLAPLHGMEQQLLALGKTGEARDLAAMRETLAQVQPRLEGSRFEPFDAQRAVVRAFFARPGARPEGLEASADRARALVERGIAEREAAFQRNPAGYVAGHPLLGREGMSTEEFCAREGITQEEYFSRSLRIQERLDGGKGVSPRVLTDAGAVELKDGYERLESSRSKAEFLRELSAVNGRYAVDALFEAGLPSGVAVFAGLYPELAASEVEKLIRASGSDLDALDLPDARKEAARQQVTASLLAKSLLTADAALSGSEAGGPGSVAAETIQTLEVFVALGGNLPDLERRVVLANAQLAGDMAAGLADAVRAAEAPPAAEASGKPRRSFWDQQAHELGVGTRGIVDGLMEAADFAAAPARGLLNFANGMAGGDPDFFKPINSSASNFLGLPMPENQWEEIAHAVSRGGSEAMFTVWGSGAIMAQKAATSASSTAWSAINSFRTAPAGQVASGIGSELGMFAAQKAGAGPVGGAVAGTAAGMLTGKGGSGGKAAAGSKAAAAENAAQAAAKGEVRAARAAEGAARLSNDVFTGKGALVFEENKWKYLFGRVASNRHNQERSAQLEKTMRDLGIKETPESQKILLDHLDEVARNAPPIASNKDSFPLAGGQGRFPPDSLIEKHSFFTGPSGVKVKLETIYHVRSDGSLRFVTTIPKYLKSNYGEK